MKRLTTMLSVILISQLVYAQTNFTEDLNANNINTIVCSNGATFKNFKKTSLPGNDAILNTLKTSGIWIAGLDQAGNIVGNIQIENENGNADFETNPEFQGIWKVSSEDVAQHLEDFNDNGVIDNTNTPLFDWPSHNNSTGYDYWIDDHSIERPFNYQPSLGDYPFPGIRGCSEPSPFGDFVWSAFQDNNNHTESDLGNTRIRVSQSVFTIECGDSEMLQNTVFVKYNFVNGAIQRLNNVRIGIYNDFEIGCSGDDYIGCIPERGIQYAYNANSTDCDGGFENNPPVHVFQVVKSPLAIKTIAENGELINPPPGESGDTVVQAVVDIFLPLDHVEENIVAPSNKNDYYNLMNGMRPDGTIIGNNGILFSGDPTNPNEVSERSENTSSGKRRTITAFEPLGFINPGVVNEFIVAHTIIGGGDMTVDETLQLLRTNTEVEDNINSCFYNNCMVTINTNVSNARIAGLKVFPNPVSETIFVEHNRAIESAQLYNLIGNRIPVNLNGNSINIEGVANGSYFLELISNGERHLEKIVVIN